MSRVGKIARLTEVIREELNRRLADGEPGSVVLPWLEGLPAGTQVMARHFGGATVTKHNLSQWRKGGFAAWRAERDLVAKTRELSSDAAELAGAVDGDITERLGTVLATHYAAALAGWDGETNETLRARLKALHELSGPIVALRQGDHAMARMKLEKERLDFARERLGLAMPDGSADLSAIALAKAKGLAEADRRQTMEYALGLPPFRDAEGRAGEGRSLCRPVEESELRVEQPLTMRQHNQIMPSSPRPSPPQVCGGEGDRSAHSGAGIPEISGVLPISHTAIGRPAPRSVAPGKGKSHHYFFRAMRAPETGFDATSSQCFRRPANA
jgi:hypothetical protein